MLLVVCPECKKLEELCESSWEKLVWEHSRWKGSRKVEISDSGITAIRHECGFEVEDKVDMSISDFNPEDAEVALFGVMLVEGKIDWLGSYWQENKEEIYRILKEKGLAF